MTVAVDSLVAIEEKLRNDFVDHMLRLADRLDAWYGVIALDEEYEAKTRVRVMDRLGPGVVTAAYNNRSIADCSVLHKRGLPGIFWRTYFGSFYVDWIGRSRFRDISGIEARELSNGAFYLTNAWSPFEWGTADAIASVRQTREHLGFDVFTDVEGIKSKVRETNTVFPYRFDLHSLGHVVRLPEFPFADELVEPSGETFSDWLESTIRYFKAYGHEVLRIEGDQVVFVTEKGGLVRVKRGPDGLVQSIPEGHA